MLDIAIIGAGPAGMSAGINAKVRNKKVEIFGVNPKNTWLYKAENINNHLGYRNVVGKEMIESFVLHVESEGIKINYGKVMQIMSMGDHFMINFENNIISAKKIILATGIEKKTTTSNEENYVGKAFSYCATCDGMLYKDKSVVVYGDSEEGEEDLKFLSEICKEVIYIYNYNSDKDFGDNVTVVKGKPTEVIGDNKAEGVIVDGKEYRGDGVFFINENTPTSTLIDGLEIENSTIVTDKTFKTNIDGIYAAGDCTGWPFQVSKAVGEGLVAVQHIVRELDNDSK